MAGIVDDVRAVLATGSSISRRITASRQVGFCEKVEEDLAHPATANRKETTPWSALRVIPAVAAARAAAGRFAPSSLLTRVDTPKLEQRRGHAGCVARAAEQRRGAAPQLFAGQGERH